MAGQALPFKPAPIGDLQQRGFARGLTNDGDV